MARLEDLTKGALVRGILGDRVVKVVDIAWHGSSARNPYLHGRADRQGRPGTALSRGRAAAHGREGRARVVDGRRRGAVPARLRGPADIARLPVRPVAGRPHLERCEPLPHQITAVYEAMLPRQPLRFLLADDPGAGKTIMAGLFIKELIVRGDLQRCLIVCPGQPGRAVAGRALRRSSASTSRSSPTTRSRRRAPATGSPRTTSLIARLDKLSPQRGRCRPSSQQTDWDLDRLRRGAQDVGAPSSAARSSTPSATSSASCSAGSPGTSC